MRTPSKTALAALLAAAAGCSQEKVTFKDIRHHPAPELSTTADSKVESQGNLAYMKNTDLRGFWDDVERAWYLDNPTRLSPFPILDTSGNPR